MSFAPASPASVAVFLIIVAAVISAWVAAVHYAYRGPAGRARKTWGFGLALAGWLGLAIALVGGDVLPRLPFSGLPFFFGSVLLVSLGVGLSPLGKQLAHTLPLPALVVFQSFRLPLELVLARWAASGTIPVEMTWHGQNWDIISGIVALLAAPWARHRALAWVANGVGSVLLLNVIRVAVLTAPLPFGWDVQPKLLLALHLPYALIGPVCVGGALAGHVVLTRALLRE